MFCTSISDSIYSQRDINTSLEIGPILYIVQQYTAVEKHIVEFNFRPSANYRYHTPSQTPTRLISSFFTIADLNHPKVSFNKLNY